MAKAKKTTKKEIDNNEFFDKQKYFNSKCTRIRNRHFAICKRNKNENIKLVNNP